MRMESNNMLEAVFIDSTPGVTSELNGELRYGCITSTTTSNSNPVNDNLNTTDGCLVADDKRIYNNFFEKTLGFQPSLVSSSTPDYLGKLHMDNLLLSHKLVLIVDLDETIIHSINYDEPKTLKSSFHFKGFTKYFYVKSRPYLSQFLNNISKFYELHIFTFGNRIYANNITKHLDPVKTYFQNRIQSIEDSICKKHKFCNLKHMFPAGDNMVCIIDDNENVWQSSPNLIRVKRYFYELASLKTEGKKEEPTDIIQEETDDYLPRLENVLMEMHDSFYKQYETNPELFRSGHLHLKTIISQRKRRVLNGCKILFKDVMFKNMKDSWLHRLAVSYGATVQTSRVDGGPDKTTHIVLIEQFREYENIIENTSLAFVNIDWLIESIENWEKADETMYPISKTSSQRYKHYFNFRGCYEEEKEGCYEEVD